MDAIAAVSELVRVSRKYIIATINLDNSYEYHPTIRPRPFWEDAFFNAGARSAPGLRQALQRRAIERYPEYEFFVHTKADASPASGL
jgi:hypothetical protein